LEITSYYLGDKKLQFLILEGKSTKSVSGELWKIFKSVGVTEKKSENEGGAVNGGKSHSVADYSDPIKTYRTFLEAIKRDDLEAAKACCAIPDNNKSGALDVLVGMWVTFHRFNNVALLKFKDDVGPYLTDDGTEKKDSPYLRTDCTDQALDRTISRLSGSKFKIEGDKAKLTVKWEKNDGYPNPAFFFSNEDETFRKIDGQWKLDFGPSDNSGKPEDLFKPGSWECAFRDGMNLMNAVIEEIESGKLKTWKQVTEQLEERTEVLGRKWAQDHEAEEHQDLKIKPAGKIPRPKDGK